MSVDVGPSEATVALDRGLRRARRHVETAAIQNLSVAVREGFEAAGTQYFLMAPDPCNDQNYGTIARCLGEHGLDGQFDGSVA